MQKTDIKIVLTQPFPLLPDQVDRLKKLGKLIVNPIIPKSAEEWASICTGADVVCSGLAGLKDGGIYLLKDVYVSLPFVGVGFLDVEKLKERNIYVSNSPGCNKDAVSEWVMSMMLNLFRQFHAYLNVKDLPESKLPDFSVGLTGKRVTILGKGNIGGTVRRLCEAFNMNVRVFSRGDNLIQSISDADVVVDCLSLNDSTKGLLDRNFFRAFKRGSFFITVTGTQIYDLMALKEALDEGIIAGAASDAGSASVGNLKDPKYLAVLEHPKILATPHIAYNSDVTVRVAYDMMIKNIEEWVKEKPINIVS